MYRCGLEFCTNLGWGMFFQWAYNVLILGSFRKEAERKVYSFTFPHFTFTVCFSNCDLLLVMIHFVVFYPCSLRWILSVTALNDTPWWITTSLADQHTAQPKNMTDKSICVCVRKTEWKWTFSLWSLSIIPSRQRYDRDICVETWTLCVWVRGTVWQDASRHVPRLVLMDIQCIRRKYWIISFARKISF